MHRGVRMPWAHVMHRDVRMPAERERISILLETTSGS
jgi:hypothetical protein